MAASLAAQATMSGVVREDSSARPLEGVEVLVAGTPHRAITGADGRYLLSNLPAGRFQLIFRLIGHLPVRLEVLLSDGEATRANATLVRSDVVLDPVEVTAERTDAAGLAGRGFEERRRMGFGRFIDAEEMRRSEHLRLDDVLKRHGVTMIGGVPMHSTSRDAQGRLDCQMAVFLDGVLVHPGGRIGSSTPDADVDLRRLYSVFSLAAAEVYRRAAQVPIEFGGSQSGCGVIVLWTRRGG